MANEHRFTYRFNSPRVSGREFVRGLSILDSNSHHPAESFTSHLGVEMTSTIDWNPILMAFVAFLSVTVTSFFAYLTVKLSKVSKVTDQVHALVNSQMGLQKKALATVSEAKAAITKDPLDIAAAATALKDWLDHEAKQVIADTKA